MNKAVRAPASTSTVGPLGPRAQEPGPQVRVVVAAYDAGRYLPAALDSLLSQTFVEWECVVVDDGSTDETADVARRYGAADRRFTLLQQNNSGSALARNIGVAGASPDIAYVAFLDADDAWLPDTLAVLVAELNAKPHAAGVYGMAEYMDGDGRPILTGLHPMRQRDRRRMGRFDLTSLGADQPYTFSSLVISGTLWPASVVLHRREVLERVGGFDPEMRQLQDWDLYLRMSRHGPFSPVHRQVAWYRQHAANITKRSERVAYYTMLVRWKAWCSTDNTPAQRRYNERVWRRLSARWFVRSLIAEVQAWVRTDRALAGLALRAAGLFVAGLVRGHPTEPDGRSARLIEMFVTGVDREGRRDAARAAPSGRQR